MDHANIAPRPACPLYVLGDIHGRMDLLDELLGCIDADMSARAVDGARIVTLGDYIDRGSDGGAVLGLLAELQARAPEDVVCLMGNHERMMLDFLDDPLAAAERWLRHGGLQTVTGLGLEEAAEDATAGGAVRLAAQLRAALPPGVEAWMRALPLWHRSGDVVCVHAAMDPVVKPESQDARTMLWDRCPRFHTHPRKDGLWVVHGHSIVSSPTMRQRRIAVDTGAYSSDRLTAAVLFPGCPVRFLQTGP